MRLTADDLLLVDVAQNVFTGNNLYEDSVLSRYIQSIFYSTLLFTGNDIVFYGCYWGQIVDSVPM